MPPASAAKRTCHLLGRRPPRVDASECSRRQPRALELIVGRRLTLGAPGPERGESALQGRRCLDWTLGRVVCEGHQADTDDTEVHMSDWIPLLAAGVAGALGLIGIIIGTRAQADILRQSQLHERQVEELRQSHDEDQRARRAVDRYREPLVRAAYDLQSRLWNILRREFLTAYAQDSNSPGWRYAAESTAWLFGQYFGWVEIIRREAQFLSLPTPEERRLLQDALGTVAHVCSTDGGNSEPLFRVFRSDQRAMGELMIIEGWDAEGGARTDCMGFAAFSSELEDCESQVNRWFDPLLKSASEFTKNPRSDDRLRSLQHALVDIVISSTPEGVRFPRDRDYA